MTKLAVTEFDRSAAEPPELTGRRAGIVTRGLAAIVDAGVVVAVLLSVWLAVAIVKFLWSPPTFRFPAPSFAFTLALGAVVEFGYLAVAWRISGRTWGDDLLGLRVVSFRGRRLTWAGAFARAAFCVLFPIGLLWVAASRGNRSVQDVVLRTSVIYDWPHRP